MIVGHGMLAKAFKTSDSVAESVCIFASGVSNSRCNDVNEFNREADLLRKKLAAHNEPAAFVYFGTCSVYDPASQVQPYVLHKLAMEQMVQMHPFGLIARLPQVAGPNASPYTLLAVLCESIRSGQTIKVWQNATRNIIDVVDVVKIVSSWTSGPNQIGKVINIANPVSHPLKTIIESVESVLGRKGKLEMVSAGAAYAIDISAIGPLIENLGVNFDKDYLFRVISRYYL